MKAKIIGIYLAFTIFGTLAVFVGTFGYTKFKRKSVKAFYEKIKNKPKVYCYETFFGGTLNDIFYIKDLKYKYFLISFYDSLEMKYNPKLNFPPQTMFYVKDPIILVEYMDKDSLIARVVDINTDCWGYIEGYVYTKTLHKLPPSDSLIKIDEEFWEERRNDASLKIRNYRAVKHSPYGIQCDGDFW